MALYYPLSTDVQQGIALVLLVGEDALDHAGLPDLPSTGGGHIVRGERLGNGGHGLPVNEQGINAPNERGLLFVDDRLPVLAAFMTCPPILVPVREVVEI